MWVHITVNSTPEQRYREDGKAWRVGLEASLEQYAAWEDIGGGTDGTIAENDYKVFVKDEAALAVLMAALQEAGYDARVWAA